MGTQRADKATRDGVGARCAAPAVPTRGAVDLALLGSADQGRSDVALPIVPTATQHDAPPVDRRQAVPGIGTMVRVVRLDAIPAMRRCPRVQDVVASCRLGPWAQASAGNRSGPSGAQSGHATLTGAFAAAAVLVRRPHPVGQQSVTRLEKNQGQGNA